MKFRFAQPTVRHEYLQADRTVDWRLCDHTEASSQHELLFQSTQDTSMKSNGADLIPTSFVKEGVGL